MKLQEIRNINRRKSLNLMRSGKHCINHLINRNNSFQHEAMKMLDATYRAYNGEEIYVEVPTIDNKNIIDVYSSDLDEADEIVVTETDKRFKEKNLPCRKQKIIGYEFKFNKDGEVFAIIWKKG